MARRLVLALLCIPFFQTANAQSVNPVIEWNRTMLTIVRTPHAQPSTIHSTRNFAILHAAIFDAVTNIDRSYTPYALVLDHVSPRTSQAAAADQAAHDVLVALYPNFQSDLDAELDRDLSSIADGREKAEGIDVGRAAASAILTARSNDGAESPQVPFVPGTQPGDYQLTPPNFAPADFTQWPQVTPFVLESAEQIGVAPPPELTSEEYTESFNQVKALGIQSSVTRTAEQTQIGKFWNGNIQDFWNEVAQSAAAGHHLDLPRTARLFALMNFALADTTISLFDAKYDYHRWRPVTAIREAGTDGNPDTAPDSNWLPLSINTAPDPTYPGAHSALSEAGAEILSLELGDRFSFDLTSESLPGVTRHFTSFQDAAREAGLSRIYAGQHFHFDHVSGRDLGGRVARSIFATSLLPLGSRP